MADRLLVDLDVGGLVSVSTWPADGLPETVSRSGLEWPLDGGALRDLRWYLEDYLRAPFGVWEDRGPRVQARLAGWGEAVFGSVFGPGPARDAYQQMRDRELELVFRSATPGLLGLPWELMRDSGGPVALNLAGMSRALPTAELAQTAAVPGGRVRVLMVISHPAWTRDTGYRVVARPLLERLDAVRGQVDLVVLRPPTLDALHDQLTQAVAAGEPFQVVHFDGHGVLTGRREGSVGPAARPVMIAGPGAEAVLAFEKPGGGSDEVAAPKVAAVLKEAGVPVVVLNACQPGALGKDVAAVVAARLLREGCAAVVAMASSMYAVAAAEFMAIFYERLFAGDTVSAAVTAGRKRLFGHGSRPSLKGNLPLADWLVPVHYLRCDVSFPQARTSRPAALPSLEDLLDASRAPGAVHSGEVGELDPAGPFAGRDEVLCELETAARLRKVVVVHGPGGTGKTELAKALGRWWRDTGGTDRPEWVVWHSFEPGVASFSLDGVIAETGLQIFGPDFARLDPDGRRARVEGLLAERRLLLIWDGFETARSVPDPAGVTAPLDDAECAKVRGFLARLAADGRSAVVIASRMPEDWLGPVRRIEVGGLAREEGVQYAGDLLAPYPAAARRRARRAFGELLEWLDGHPLSMRLILPRLDGAGPGALLEGVRGTTPLPVGDDRQDRATPLAASITYSLAHLTAQTRRLLPAVGLFHGIADTDLLAIFSAQPGVPGRFAGASSRDWKQVLDDAATVGLLTSLGPGTFRVHPVLPAYLAARWRAEDPGGHDGVRDGATRALATACAGLGAWLSLQIRSGDAGSAHAIIGLQRRTFSAMLGYAADHQMWEQAQAIARVLNSYWYARGLDEEADTWTGRLQIATGNPDGSPPRLGTPAGDLWLFITSAQANRRQRVMRLDDAERTYRQILDMLQAQPSSSQQQSDIAGISHNLGMAAHDRGRLGEAEDWYLRAVAIEEGLGNRPGTADSYHQLGMVAQERGRLDEAEDWYRKSLAVSQDLGDRPAMADSYHQLGMVAQERGRLDKAGDWYRTSLAIVEGLGNRPGMAASHHQLGRVAQDQGRPDEAEDRYLRALVIEEDLGNRAGMANNYHQLGVVAQRGGRLDDAEDWYRKSLAVSQDLGNRAGLADSFHQLGMLAQDRERLDEAEDWYRKSVAIEEEAGNRAGLANSYHQLGMVAQDRGRLDEAEDWYRKSLAIKGFLGNRAGMANSYGQLGLLAEQRGQPRQALDWMVRCVTLFGEFPHPLTGPGPDHLARLTAQLGIGTLRASWLEITGSPLPQAVRDYVSSSPASG